MQKQQQQQQQQRQRVRKIDWNVHRLIWRPWLISLPEDLQTSNKLLIDSMKCNQRQNSLSTLIRLNFVRLQMQNIKLNCNIASASQYNDCLGTRSKCLVYFFVLWDNDFMHTFLKSAFWKERIFCDIPFSVIVAIVYRLLSKQLFLISISLKCG